MLCVRVCDGVKVHNAFALAIISSEKAWKNNIFLKTYGENERKKERERERERVTLSVMKIKLPSLKI